MKVEIISKNFIKPSTPTPPNLQTYNISSTDEVAPRMYIPIILYYPAATNGVTDGNATSTLVFNQLKDSLEQTLTHFYPLAGRYVKETHLVDCNDQGVEYVEAQVKGQLSEILGQRSKIKSEFLNNFIPCEIGAVDEVTDPLLSIQVNLFDCGGLAVGVCISHRVGDATTLSIFVNAWASASGGKKIYENGYSIFNSASFFPGRNLPGTEVGIPRAISNNGLLATASKMFLFNAKAISTLKGEARAQGVDTNVRPPSRVQLVFALIWRALMSIDKGRSPTSYVFQPVNIRERSDPPVPKLSCGNFWGVATSKLMTSESEGMEYQGFVDVLTSNVRDTLKDYEKVLCDGEEGKMIVINPLSKMNEIAGCAESSAYWFSSWSKFSFYEADFGWGKPEWTSSVHLRGKNGVFLMDDKEGNGIEAWVHLDEKDMMDFEQDCNIRAFAT